MGIQGLKKCIIGKMDREVKFNYTGNLIKIVISYYSDEWVLFNKEHIWVKSKTDYTINKYTVN